MRAEDRLTSDYPEEWRATSKNPWRYEPVGPGREVAPPAPELWGQYARELGALRERLRRVLMQVARTDNPTVKQAMLLRELVKLASTLNAMHTAAGDARPSCAL